jgi:hypothetical protein
VSRLAIVVFDLHGRLPSIILPLEIGLKPWLGSPLMGVIIGSAACPLWNMMNLEEGSSVLESIIAAWSGLSPFSLAGAAQVQSGSITIDTPPEPNLWMLSGT